MKSTTCNLHGITEMTPERFDRMMGTPPNGGSTLAIESLWGTRTIARFMGVSVDFVRKLEMEEATFPARRRGGRLYVTKTEVVVWLAKGRGKTS
ncbi:helix-turn-helix domain-containing protein [Falsochrobactrum sp. TDYN1]|uniref:Helix-turn-helix domain-containing protein n=1 Tax=Falsochrobactrum tianjinense TaxID=2706015 RepID=A0A949UTT5_9HYPH|nr:helix-turn-helix domain-containing protein [Falsochrobactrum sp. TDYN1]MBV2144419.1 helix-turn-helix domain-containing protein [Falsochrobactrum sp. TDYN1]